MRILEAIFLLMLALVVVNLLQAELRLSFAAVGAVIGLLMGVLGRLLEFVWDPNIAKAVSQPNIIGGTILISRFAFAFSRHGIFGHRIQVLELNGFTLAVFAGIILGRLVATDREVFRVLLQNDALNERWPAPRRVEDERRLLSDLG